MIQDKIFITLKKLKRTLVDKDINVSKATLWKTVRGLGFTFRSTKSGRSHLCERADLVAWRCRYLRKIKQYRQEGKPIIYQDETWVNAHHTFPKEWTSTYLSISRQIPSSKGERLIISHAGSKDGFVKDGSLVFRSKSKDNRDYHSEMNGTNFKKYLKEKLLPNITEKSVIVLDNAPYHNFVEEEDQVPTSSWLKARVVEWFQKKDIPYPDKAFKYELLEMVKKMNLEKRYAVDEIIKAEGHIPLRLPPYHSQLNPIELIWAQVKKQVADENTTFNIKDVEVLTKKALDEVTPESWKKCVEHVEKVENDYWKNDGIGYVQAPIIIYPFDSDSDSEQGLEEDD